MIEKICVGCGKRYDTLREESKYCDHNCYSKNHRVPNKKIFKDDEKVIVKLYTKENRSAYFIARMFKCSYVVIYKILKKNNIRTFPNGFFSKKDNSIELVECKTCNKNFKSYVCNRRKFCSKGCYSLSKRGNVYSEKTRLKISRSLKGRIFSDEHRRNMSKSKEGLYSGEKNPMYGKVHPNRGKKIHTEEHKKYIRHIMGSEEYRNKASLRTKKNWDNPEYAKKTSEAIIKGLLKRPTSYEKKISELCIENNLPFVYTGDGTFLIGHKNPDFVNKKERIAIEVYHDYWKIRDFGSCEEYERQRSEYFDKYGYKTIFIRTEEIMDKNWKELCANKIQEFIR